MNEASRLDDVEMALMHLQRDVEALNSVILEQQREIAALKTLLSRLEERVTGAVPGETPFDPVLEKPPHY